MTTKWLLAVITTASHLSCLNPVEISSESREILPSVVGVDHIRPASCFASQTCAGGAPQQSHRRVKIQRVNQRVTPRLYLVEDFASPDEIDHIMRVSEPRLTPSHKGTVTGVRYELPIDGDPILERIRERMMSMFPGLKTRHEPTFRVRKYTNKSFHPPHVDYFESDDGSVLVLTIMLYLHSPDHGGETAFPRANGGKGYAFAPTSGNVAAWWSIYGQGDVRGKPGAMDPRTLHEGRPVQKGIKWNATLFVYADPKQAAAVEAASHVHVPV
ncbi:hypothetical protein AAMO2058_001608400 [Amorphochlora amoebiformis]